MTKTHTTLTVDSDLLTRAKRLGINISGELNEFLRLKLARINNNPKKIDLILEKKQLKKVEKQLEILKIEQKSILDTIKIVEKDIEKKELKKLEEEKKKIEEQKTCAICKTKILEWEDSEELEDGRFIHSNVSSHYCIRIAYRKGLKFKRKK